MDVTQEFLNLIELIADTFEIPPVDTIFIPNQEDFNLNYKKDNFGAIKLNDGSTGIFFIGLHTDFHESIERVDYKKLVKENPLDLASKFNSETLFDRTIGLGAINAISHFLFTLSNFQFNYSNNILNNMKIQSGDIIGMVGYFPPLVEKLNLIGNKLVIVELKEELIKKTPNWEITLDTSKLTMCNKIICTSTTLINDTLDNILGFTRDAELFALIGPTAGFLPDPLFQRKIDIIGGSIANNSKIFFERIIQGERWGNSVSKYVIHKEHYPGIKNLINLAKKMESC